MSAGFQAFCGGMILIALFLAIVGARRIAAKLDRAQRARWPFEDRGA